MRPAVLPSATSNVLWTRDFVLVCGLWLVSMVSLQLPLAAWPLYVIESGGNAADVGLVIGVYSIAAVLARPFVGRELDIRGRKKFLVVGAAIITTTTLAYTFTSTIPV